MASPSERGALLRVEYLRERANLVRDQAGSAELLILSGEGFVSGHFAHVTTSLNAEQVSIDILLRCSPWRVSIVRSIRPSQDVQGVAG